MRSGAISPRPRWPNCGSSRTAGQTSLAEVAGLLEGAREGEPDEPLTRQAAGLCRKAGADLEAIPAWIAEGPRRRARRPRGSRRSPAARTAGAQLDINAR